ncbi:MAG: hypothetical protein V1809_06125 [Planctomycetota bacterium]
MNSRRMLWGMALVVAAGVAGAVRADSVAKTYQVTGPVLEVSEKKIVVQKGDEKWEIVRDEATKSEGEIKVGDKVTIVYRMVATSVKVKGAGEEEKAGEEKKDEGKKDEGKKKK